MSAKIAVVTGGSRGIGRAVVQALAAQGYRIEFCYQSNAEQARQVCLDAERLGQAVGATRCDVGDAKAVAAWIAGVEKQVGPIDVLVNSAGITRDSHLVTMSTDDWQAVIDANLTGVFNLCRAVAFAMFKRRRGCIINMSSVSGVYGNATQSNYAATKAGIIGFSRSLAKELGPQGIRVNVVAPGMIATDMTARMAADRLERMVAAVPLRRIGEADDVAALVTFLASEQARYITAQVIGVDGGLVI
jgi:3-oxoacyl-[acyl-carrier protein] reductase